MKGLVVIPTFYQTRHTDFWKVLLEMIRDRFGFELRYTDELGEVPKDLDVIIPFSIPQHSRVGYMPELLSVPKSIKIIALMRDVQCYSDECWDWNRKMFDRFDVILNPTDEAFRRWYPEYYEKTVFLPQYFTTHERYANLPYNNFPKMKCLLIGAINPKIYPLRHYIRKNGNPTKIDFITTGQGKRQGYIKDEYAKLLNSYFCCVASSSIFDYAIMKSTEITAAGALLLVNEVEDMKKMGYIPGKHYVSITQKNSLKKIYDCLEHPEKYEGIRKAGRTFTLENHSVLNRFEQVRKILERG